MLKNTKLIQFLTRLNSAEWQALGRFLKSPYFNTNKKLVLLYEVLAPFFPDFSNRNLTREKLAKSIYNNSTARAIRQLANLMTHFVKLLPVFFSVQQLQKEPRLGKQLTGTYYAERNWYDWFDKNTRSLLAEIQALPVQSIEDHFTIYRTSLHHYYHPGTSKMQVPSASLQDSVEGLTSFILREILRLGCEVKMRRVIVSDHTVVPLLEEARTLAGNRETPVLRLYLLFLELLETGHIDHYDKVREAYFATFEMLDPLDRINLFAILSNFVKLRIHKGDGSFHTQLFELDKQGLQLDLFMENEHINSAHFSNIVVNAIKLKELHWAHQFIDQYQHALQPKDRKVLVHYARALIAMATHQFEKALDLLNEIEGIPHDHAFLIKSMSIRCLLELYLQQDSYDDLLLSRIKSFEQYIRRDKTWEKGRKKAYLLFCKTIAILMQLKYHKNEKVIGKVNNELQTQPVVARSWLLEKLDQLT